MYDAYEPEQRHQSLGSSLGGGVTVQATEGLPLGAEGRWHTNLTDGPWMSFAQPWDGVSNPSGTASVCWSCQK